MTTQAGTAAGHVLTVTDGAARKARQLAERQGRPGACLRVRVTAGGCSGFSYELSFDDETEADDHVIDGRRRVPRAGRSPERAHPAGLHGGLRRRADGRRPEDAQPAGHPRVRLRRLLQRLTAACSGDLQRARHRRVDLAVEPGRGLLRPRRSRSPSARRGSGSSTLPSSSVNVWSVESLLVIVMSVEPAATGSVAGLERQIRDADRGVPARLAATTAGGLLVVPAARAHDNAQSEGEPERCEDTPSMAHRSPFGPRRSLRRSLAHPAP